MAGELSWELFKRGVGVSTAISVGGDAPLCSNPLEFIRLFEKDPHTRIIGYYGEPGTQYEEDIAEYAQQGSRKPIVALLGGWFVEEIAQGLSFGHAATFVENDKGAVSAKCALFEAAGIGVAKTITQWGDLISSKLRELEP